MLFELFVLFAWVFDYVFVMILCCFVFVCGTGFVWFCCRFGLLLLSCFAEVLVFGVWFCFLWFVFWVLLLLVLCFVTWFSLFGFACCEFCFWFCFTMVTLLLLIVVC